MIFLNNSIDLAFNLLSREFWRIVAFASSGQINFNVIKCEQLHVRKKNEKGNINYTAHPHTANSQFCNNALVPPIQTNTDTFFLITQAVCLCVRKLATRNLAQVPVLHWLSLCLHSNQSGESGPSLGTDIGSNRRDHWSWAGHLHANGLQSPLPTEVHLWAQMLALSSCNFCPALSKSNPHCSLFTDSLGRLIAGFTPIPKPQPTAEKKAGIHIIFLAWQLCHYSTSPYIML